MSKKLVFSLFVIGTLAISTTFCKKKSTGSIDNESQSILDNALASQEFMSIIPIFHQLAINTKGTGTQNVKTTTTCDTLSRLSGDTLFGSTNHKDPVYTANLGSGLCGQARPDGKERSGVLNIRLGNKIKTPGTRTIIKISQYRVGDLMYSCDSIVLITLNSTSLVTTFQVKVVNGLCKTDLWAIKYSCDFTLNHHTAASISDSYVSVYGQASGRNRTGKTFSVSIAATTPLLKYLNCPYFNSGIEELTPEGYGNRTVDYGNGDCDNKASFSVNGNSIAFNLK